jgi:hypothetical protein
MHEQKHIVRRGRTTGNYFLWVFERGDDVAYPSRRRLSGAVIVPFWRGNLDYLRGVVCLYTKRTHAQCVVCDFFKRGSWLSLSGRELAHLRATETGLEAVWWILMGQFRLFFFCEAFGIFSFALIHTSSSSCSSPSASSSSSHFLFVLRFRVSNTNSLSSNDVLLSCVFLHTWNVNFSDFHWIFFYQRRSHTWTHVFEYVCVCIVTQHCVWVYVTCSACHAFHFLENICINFGLWLFVLRLQSLH